MSGLYSPINKLMEQVTRPKGTGAEYMAELQKKPGYKPAEAEDRDLQALMALPQMERAAFMEKLKAQKNNYPLKHRELTGNQTHHEQYTLPGGENYREILLHTPMPEGQGFPGVPHHFGGMPNILASIMAKDRISPEGKKMLHLEEIQSDWHQQGRDNGYRTPEMEKEIKEVKAWKKRLQHDLRHGGYGMSAEEHEEASEALRKADDELYNLEEDLAKAVPRGPHAKDWHELALKAMIQHAAENGYDQIAINHGKTVADRYSLAKEVKALSYNPDSQYFQAIGHDNQPLINESNADFDRVKELVGKDVAEKLLETPKSLKNHYLETEGLTVGDKGMKGFYDKMVPTFLNKFGKKHGVQVQQGRLPGDPSERGNAAEALGVAHVPLAGMAPEQVAAFNQRLDDHNAKPVHTFDITPAMREDVLKNGIPRYAEGGDVSRETADANKAKFMKGSKAPERLYHGTGNLEALHSFDPAMTGKGLDQLGSGFYFASDPQEASGYAMHTHNAPSRQGEGKIGGSSSPGVVAAHVNIKKPIRIGKNGMSLNDAKVNLSHDQVKQIMGYAPNINHPDESPLGNHVDTSRGVTPQMIHDIAKLYTGNNLYALENDIFPNEPTAYRNALHQVTGHDGVIKDFGNGRKHYVAWFPHQIKSAIGNRGTYDTNEADITKKRGGEVTMPPSMDMMQYELINRKAK